MSALPCPPDSLSTALAAAADFLGNPGPLLITSHVNSDGDGIAGGLALASLVRQLGHDPALVLQDVPAGDYGFLAGSDQIAEATTAPATRFRRAAVLDCPNLARIGDVQGHLEADGEILNIDHHHDNESFGTVNLISPEVCSTCEALYHLAVHLGLDIDRDTAEQLYTGILFDTGGFRYSLTTPTSMEVGANLVRHGARLDRIADRLYNNATLDDVKLAGRAIDSLQLYLEDRVAVMVLTLQNLEHGDPESAVNHGLRIRSVEVSVLLKEIRAGHFRASLRSREAVDVSVVAHGFGGGGHARAAGCSLDGDAEGVRKRLLARIAQALP